MPIEGFDYKEFAKGLAGEVGPALPPEISDADKQYVINLVYNFCYMAGEAIYNDTTVELNAQQATMITQFIGEWTFHKSIDTIKSGIDPQFRDALLQKVAFTVFEIAKTAIVKGMSQADVIAIVEIKVKQAYTEGLEELKNQGVLTEEQVAAAASRSNIDEMAQAQAAAQQEAEMQGGQGASDDYVNQVSDNKILKLATFAIVLRHLPFEKRQNLLGKFSQEDADILRDYANMEDLENKLDRGLVVKCLNEIKNSLPEPKKVISSGKVYDKLYKIVKNSNISKISNIINKERSEVKNLILGIQDGNETKISPRIADIICTHLEEKLGR